MIFRGVSFDSVVKTEIYVSMRKLYGMKIFPKSIQFLKCFRIQCEYITKCLWKVSSEAVKTDFNVSKRFRWANFSFWKFFTFFSDLKLNFLWNSLKSFSWQKCFLSVCKIFQITKFLDTNLYLKISVVVSS